MSVSILALDTRASSVLLRRPVKNSLASRRHQVTSRQTCSKSLQALPWKALQAIIFEAAEAENGIGNYANRQ